MTGKDAMQIPADTRLAEELAEDDVVEMANLTTCRSASSARRRRKSSPRKLLQKHVITHIVNNGFPNKGCSRCAPSR
jgi:hypothetical protein